MAATAGSLYLIFTEIPIKLEHTISNNRPYKGCRHTLLTKLVADAAFKLCFKTKGTTIFHIYFIFDLFREGCPSTEVVFQGALQ